MDNWLRQLLDDLRTGRAADLAGTRIATDLAISDRLINQVLAEKIRPDGAVREISVQSRDGDARVRVTMAKPAFLPPITLTLTVEQQARLPESPVVVLKISMGAGVAALLGAGISLLNVLPAGHRLEGDRLFIDVAAVLNDRGYGWVVRYLRSLTMRFEPGRVVHFIELG